MRFHLFPFRTQKLSSIALKVLCWQRHGRIRSCRIQLFLVSSAVEHPAVNRRVVGSNPTRGAIFVVRKSYNSQKAQDTQYLVLFCYYILCFCRWTKSLNLTAAFRRFFQKTGLELTTYRFCSIGYYNFIIIFKREQVFRFSLFCCCLSVVSQR